MNALIAFLTDKLLRARRLRLPPRRFHPQVFPKEQGMKRFHVHVAVPDLENGIRFYSTVFGAEPNVLKSDYAKWMLEDPRVNFAISQRGMPPGLITWASRSMTRPSWARSTRVSPPRTPRSSRRRTFRAATRASDKYWVTDPAGVALGDFPHAGFGADVFGRRRMLAMAQARAAPMTRPAP
jgi:hypothetical protein